MITIDTYDDLRFWVKVFADEKAELLIIEGRPGLGKSRIVNETLNGKALRILGHVTPLAFYRSVYYHEDKPIIVDDVETLLNNKEMTGLLKQICETEKEKNMNWLSTSKMLGDVPQEFKTSSKVCVVCNDFRILTKKIRAVQDRGWHIRFEPSIDEILKQMEFIKASTNSVSEKLKEEIFDTIKRYSRVSVGLSLRSYVKAIELSSKTTNWKEWLLRDLKVNQKLIVIDSLLQSFETDKERVAAWKEKGYSERGYWDYKKRYNQHCKTAPEIKICV